MGSADRHIKAICKLFDACQYRHDRYTLFSDFIEAAAISLSNSVDLTQSQARETRYMEIIGRYDRDVIDTFPGSVAKIVKLEHAWRRLDGRNDDGFQVAPFPG